MNMTHTFLDNPAATKKTGHQKAPSCRYCVRGLAVYRIVYRRTISVAMFSQNALSCSTKRMVG